MPPKAWRREALALGAFLTALQILVVCWMAPNRSMRESYSRLCAWDCGWYERIAREGYHSPVPPVGQNGAVSDVAFFPAYPYLGRVASAVLGVEIKTGLLIVAQVFCVLFWAALWTLLKRWKIPEPVCLLVVLAVLAHPAAFFLVSGYSESLFLSALLLFVADGAATTRNARRSASLAGFAMSATRIVGVPAAGFPVLHQLVRAWSRPGRRLIGSMAVSGVAMLGTLLFLLYCQLRFGEYNLYMETQRVGWGIVPDYGAILKWGTFHFNFPIDRIATWMSGWAFAILLEIEVALAFFRRPTGFGRRLPVYVTAFLIFFITLSGLKSVSFTSMIRYTLPWYILLIVCLAHLSLRLPRLPLALARTGFAFAVMGLIALLYLVELPHLRDFLNGQWYA